jgi:hypothetical protein
MVQKSSKLDVLPKSGDKFWSLAETKLIDMNYQVPKCEHYMVRRSGTQAECEKCRIGYFTGPFDRVKDGHLYRGDIRII